MRVLHIRAGEIEVKGREGLHRDSRMACVPVKERWVNGGGCSPVFLRNAANVPVVDVYYQLARKPEGVWRLAVRTIRRLLVRTR